MINTLFYIRFVLGKFGVGHRLEKHAVSADRAVEHGSWPAVHPGADRARGHEKRRLV